MEPPPFSPATAPSDGHGRAPWWRRLAALPGRLWGVSGEIVDAAWPNLGPRRRAVARAAVSMFLILVYPFSLPLAGWYERRPGTRLRRQAAKLWSDASPYESLALVRDIHTRLAGAHRAGALGGFRGSLEIPPFGRFGAADAIEVMLTLYDWLVSLGFYEEARELMAEQPPSEPTVLWQVDCLLKMHRKNEAIRLLEQSLHLDGRRGILRRRLDALTGSHLRSVN